MSIYKIKLLDKELVQKPKEEPSFITLFSFGWLKPKGEKPRSRPTLIPPNLVRSLPTQVEVELHKDVLLYPITPPALSEQGVEIVGVHIDPANSQMMVRAVSYNPQPVYLAHGTPLVKLAFFVPIKLLEEGSR